MDTLNDSPPTLWLLLSFDNGTPGPPYARKVVINATLDQQGLRGDMFVYLKYSKEPTESTLGFALHGPEWYQDIVSLYEATKDEVTPRTPHTGGHRCSYFLASHSELEAVGGDYEGVLRKNSRYNTPNLYTWEMLGSDIEKAVSSPAKPLPFKLLFVGQGDEREAITVQQDSATHTVAMSIASRTQSTHVPFPLALFRTVRLGVRWFPNVTLGKEQNSDAFSAGLYVDPGDGLWQPWTRSMEVCGQHRESQIKVTVQIVLDEANKQGNNFVLPSDP